MRAPILRNSPATATAAVKAINAAANAKPAKPISLDRKVFDALMTKLVKMAKTNAPQASGLVDLITELNKKGSIELNFNSGPIAYAQDNEFKQRMNEVKEVLNSNAVRNDNKKVDTMMAK